MNRIPGFTAESVLEQDQSAQYRGARAQHEEIDVVPQGCCTCTDAQSRPISRFYINGWCPWAAAKCYAACPFGRGSHSCGGC